MTYALPYPDFSRPFDYIGKKSYGCHPPFVADDTLAAGIAVTDAFRIRGARPGDIEARRKAVRAAIPANAFTGNR